MSWINAA